MDKKNMVLASVFDNFERCNDCSDEGQLISDIIREVAEQSSQITLGDILKFDAERSLVVLSNLLWYHGSITRDKAVEILKNGSDSSVDGYFLVRDSSSNISDYVISISVHGRIKHYHVERKSDAFFKIDNSPVIFGIEKLVSYYRDDAHGLDHRLVKSIHKNLPPLRDLRYGYTNLLHRAVREGNSAIVRKILNSAECPDINAKNYKGSTALHTASTLGNDDIAIQLIKNGSDVQVRDSHGATPLHRACTNNRANTARILVTLGKANPQERCHPTAVVPMHEAAVYGHIETVKVLLDMNIPCWPRNDDGDTPYQLALRHGHEECAEIIGTHKSPPASTHRSDWYHEQLSRQEAVPVLDQYIHIDGLFIVRNSSSHPSWYVLSVVYERMAYHFKIKLHLSKMYFIDDGPLLRSLEHLVQHYMTYVDGLPCLLRMALKKDGTIKSMISPVSISPTISRQQTLSTKPSSCQQQLRSLDDLDLNPRVGPSASSPDLTTTRPLINTENDGTEDDAGYLPSASNISRSSDDYQVTTSLLTTRPVIHIPAADICLGKELGQGEFGAVYEAEWRKPGAVNNVSVAVKSLHPEHVQLGRKQFLSEAQVMVDLDHPCIVKLIGVSPGPPMMIIEELLSMGSMLCYLWDQADSIEVTTDLYLWAAQIACGMMYLEKKKCVHRDLAARNILMATPTQVKISDFGLSRAIGTENDYYRSVRGGKWPVKWYAPECINFGTFSHASDVWSYGVTLWEMFSFGLAPYENVPAKEIIHYLEAGGRLECPETCPAPVYLIMRQCWELSLLERPTFAQLHTHFKTDPEYAQIRELVKTRR